MSEERKKKSGAAWKAEEDEKLNKSRAFVELTEYIANEVENDTHFFILAELHIKLYSVQRYTLCSPTIGYRIDATLHFSNVFNTVVISI